MHPEILEVPLGTLTPARDLDVYQGFWLVRASAALCVYSGLRFRSRGVQFTASLGL